MYFSWALRAQLQRLQSDPRAEVGDSGPAPARHGAESVSSQSQTKAEDQRGETNEPLDSPLLCVQILPSFHAQPPSTSESFIGIAVQVQLPRHK